MLELSTVSFNAGRTVSSIHPSIHPSINQSWVAACRNWMMHAFSTCNSTFPTWWKAGRNARTTAASLRNNTEPHYACQNRMMQAFNSTFPTWWKAGRNANNTEPHYPTFLITCGLRSSRRRVILTEGTFGTVAWHRDYDKTPGKSLGLDFSTSLISIFRHHPFFRHRRHLFSHHKLRCILKNEELSFCVHLRINPFKVLLRLFGN